MIAWGGADTLKLVAARAVIAGIIILPTTFCLGVSFPFLGSLAAQAESNATYYLAKLYCINPFGAALCALTAPFLIFPKVGLSGALVVCIVVDASVALYAGWRVRGAGDTAQTTEESSEFRWEASDAVILGVAFISGLPFFALEVIWTHLVGVVTGTSVYAFSSMLFVVPIGLAAGSFQIGRACRRRARPFVGVVLSLREHSAGAGRALAIGSGWNRAFGPVCHRLLFRRNGPSRHLHCASAARYLSVRHLSVAVSGGTFPSPGRGSAAGLHGGSERRGGVALVATFLLIPRVGSEWSLRWFTVVLALCGIATLRLERKSMRDGWIAAAMLSAVAFGVPSWNRLCSPPAPTCISDTPSL